MQQIPLILKCEFSLWSREPYTCNMEWIEIKSPGIEIKEINGEHLPPGKSNGDVKKVKFENVPVEFLPRGLFTGEVQVFLKFKFTGCVCMWFKIDLTNGSSRTREFGVYLHVR